MCSVARFSRSCRYASRLAAFASVTGQPAYVDFLDFNGDGAINNTDLAQFRSRFGTVLP